MKQRIVAIAFVYICTVIAWMILAGTVFDRSTSLDLRMKKEVSQLWGSKLAQQQPVVGSYYDMEGDVSKSICQAVPLDSSDVAVNLDLDYRKKGLLWYSTYRVDFSGKYEILNSSDVPRRMDFSFALPSVNSVYDDFHLIVGGEEVEDVKLDSGRVSKSFKLEGGESKDVVVAYKTQGLDEWSYNFGENVQQIKEFSLVINTDFDQIDFPQQSISPTKNEVVKGGKKLSWQYNNLMTGVNIGMVMPKKLNPGPWVGQLTMAAPVSLFLFFFLMMVITSVKKVKLHPMHYFFLGCSFFSFHLLLAYLVDHVSIHCAFWICSAVSVFLVLTYMRIVTGAKFALFEVGLSQMVYLVLFSYSFFFKGYTGLSITVLCICTLFIVMQCTAKVDWEEIFAVKEDDNKNRPAKRVNMPPINSEK